MTFFLNSDIRSVIFINICSVIVILKGVNEALHISKTYLQVSSNTWCTKSLCHAIEQLRVSLLPVPRWRTAICLSVNNIVDVPYTSFVYFRQNPVQSVTTENWSATVIFAKMRTLKTILLCVKECQFVLKRMLVCTQKNFSSYLKNISSYSKEC